MKADLEDRLCMRDIRDALFAIGGLKRKSDIQREAVQAVDHANGMLHMFEEVAP